MSRKISIGWLMQRSGRYALKGVTIYENAQSYDSTSTFRDEDARWLTKVLGADADVELSGSKGGERTPEGYPEWAVRTGQETNNDPVPPLDWERASATLLRHCLSRLVAACESENGSTGIQYLTNEATAALLATDAGTFYTLDEARTILDRRGQKLGRIKSKQ